jgi:hypothetical protein
MTRSPTFTLAAGFAESVLMRTDPLMQASFEMERLRKTRTAQSHLSIRQNSAVTDDLFDLRCNVAHKVGQSVEATIDSASGDWVNKNMCDPYFLAEPNRFNHLV